ncbi:MAG: hypothetical protein AB1656_08465 [Candidatus Omnitrophota bacterium]
MEKGMVFENYPLWMVLVSNSLSLAIYALGIILLYELGAIYAVLYLAYCVWMEFRLLRGSCAKCYYYGKTCCFGKGRLCSFFMKKNESQKFGEREITWKDLLPDLMVFVFPFIGGIVLLFLRYHWMILVWMAALFLLSFPGNGVVRGSLACKYCRQRELGCPAERLFNKGNDLAK